jgi:hypothetical protein
MTEDQPQEQAVPAEQPQEVLRNMVGFLAQDLNTVATSVAATWVAAKVITKGNDQDPPQPDADPPQ